MKIRLLTLTLAVCSLGTMAQNGKVISTYEFLKAGDLLSAKEAIDEAVEHEKTKDKAKTWFYYGNTYNAIARAEKSSTRKIDPDAGEKAIEGYLKALKFDSKEKYKAEITAELEILKTLMLNKAIKAYNEKGYEFAYKKFLTAHQLAEMIELKDTVAAYYGAVAANQAGLKNEAIALFETCVAYQCCGPEVYLSMAAIYREQENQAALTKIVQEGRAAYPNHPGLILEALNLQLNSKNYTEAINTIQLAIDNDPENPQLFFALGMAHDFSNNRALAIDAYEKALQIDPNHFESLFNLGALHNNIGDEFIEQANELDYKTEQDKIKALKTKANKAYHMALPHLEKAYAFAGTDADVKQSLKILYTKLGLLEKAQALEE